MAHWFFGHQYFKIAIVMPEVKLKQEVPEEIDNQNARRDKLMVTLNLIPPAAFGIALYG